MFKLLMKIFRRYPILLKWMSDEQCITFLYWMCMGKKPDLLHPRTYNEKVQWLKLHDRKPFYASLADKEEVKKYIAEKAGEEYVIPTLGIWERFSDIDFDTLPEQFVLKCTHDSGSTVICTDKKRFNVKKARRKLERCLRRDYYSVAREWSYKGIHPRIIAEPYLENENGDQLMDYKFFCFDGEPKLMYVASGRENGQLCFDYFDMDFQHLDIRRYVPNADFPIHKPDTFQKMKELSAVLSRGFAHLRVDLYQVNNRVYVGELTFYHHSGMVNFKPEIWDSIMGDWLKLPKNAVQ